MGFSSESYAPRINAKQCENIMPARQEFRFELSEKASLCARENQSGYSQEAAHSQQELNPLFEYFMINALGHLLSESTQHGHLSLWVSECVLGSILRIEKETEMSILNMWSWVEKIISKIKVK